MGDLMVAALAFIAAAASAIAAAIALDLIRDQAKASTPWLVDWLRRQAVKRLPEQMRDEVAEEWAAWLDETPGPLAKLCCALGFLISAFKVQATPSLQTKNYDNLIGVDEEIRRLMEIAKDIPDLISEPEIIMHEKGVVKTVTIKAYKKIFTKKGMSTQVIQIKPYKKTKLR